MRKIADALNQAGYPKEVGGFIFSMNRAAERAAPRVGRLSRIS